MFSKKEVAAIKQMLTQPKTSQPQKAKPKRKRRANNKPKLTASMDAPVRISRPDYFISCEVSPQNQSGWGTFSPSHNAMKVLNKFAAIYECYIIHSVVMEFKTASNRMKDGQIIIAVDYGSKRSITITKENLLVMANVHGPVWQDARLPIKVDPKVVRYTDKSDDNRDEPFIIHWMSSIKTAAGSTYLVGDIYLRYDITFYGLKPT